MGPIKTYYSRSIQGIIVDGENIKNLSFRYRIVDVTGHVIQSGIKAASQQNIPFDNLSGLYYLHLFTDSENYISPFILGKN